MLSKIPEEVVASPKEDYLTSASRGTLSPPTRREWAMLLGALLVIALVSILDYRHNGSLGLRFAGAWVVIATAASASMASLGWLVRRRAGETPPSSTVAMLLAVYAGGLAPPLAMMSGLWLEEIASDDPFFEGVGLLVSLLTWAGPALELAWRHWHVRSLQRFKGREQAARLSELEQLAFKDALTGLANRRCFEREVAAALVGVPAGGSLLLIDLDRFKPVNDTYGHAAGDSLLQEIARRLRGAVREGDLVARLGGDEFAILLRGADSAAAGRITAERIKEALKVPFQVCGAVIQPGASIGYADLDRDLGAEESLRVADAAMYRAKSEHVRHSTAQERSVG